MKNFISYNCLLYAIFFPSASLAVNHLKGSSKRASVGGGEHKKRQDQTIGGSTLPSEGYCWIHENGKLCFQYNSFQSITKVHDELFYESFIDGTKYSYFMTDVDKLKNDYASLPPSGDGKLDHAISEFEYIFDAYEGIKYGCEVEDAGDVFFDSSDFEIVTVNADGSSIQKFHDMIIYVDSANMPINIQIPSEEGGYKLLAVITDVELIKEGTSFETCNPDKDVDDMNALENLSSDSHKRLLNILDAHDPSVSEEEYFEKVGESHRRLNFLVQFQAWASNTNWCGAGNDITTTPCPDISDTSKDFWADVACRRHDHGAKTVSTYIGLPRLECIVDKQLVDLGGHNYAVSAAYGKYGVMGAIGCYNWEPYRCWRNWSYRHCGYKWDINRGPWRYNGAVRRDGYQSRPKFCVSDNWITW